MLKSFTDRLQINVGRLSKQIVARVVEHGRELLIAIILAVVTAAGFEWWESRAKQQALDEARAAVVTVLAFDSKNKPISQGSGIFVNSSGLLATNFHVIREASSLVARLPNGAVFLLQDHGVRFADAENDIALLQFDAKNTSYVQLGNPAKLTAGELAYAIGTPEGQESTISMGNISNPDSVISGQHFIQFTAPISPGSSGGGLFVENGDIVGITSASLGSDRAQNLNYAIPVSYLRAAMNRQPKIGEGSPMYYYVQGGLVADKRDWQLAIGYYSKAIELNANYADAYAARGGIYYTLGKFDQQLRDFLKANQLAPNDSDISYDVATAYEDFGRF
jgi:S1-C subfamily serine protease